MLASRETGSVQGNGQFMMKKTQCPQQKREAQPGFRYQKRVAGEVTLKLRLEGQNGKHHGKQEEKCCRLGNGRCLNPEFSRIQRCSGAENQVKKDRVDRSSAETVTTCL